ncbi:MAG: metal ABC transporter ATP-binding protein [Ruminococcus sp.]|nr:metal ABC transporter ATP-binding protein [Ruminococcus sp.]MDE6538725.1 metal ABC transporter ATP-binding protein [Ruminococcus sp.]
MKKRIICKNASLGYEDGIVTENLDFTVNSGDYLCILGENGSGKSTLIKALLGLKSAVSGEIIWEGLSARDIGYLPQQTPVQRDFPASVREIVLSGCLAKCGFRPFYNKTEKKLAEDNMKKLHIDHLADHCYRELSGGQQQRVLLARALCATSEMLLLDEPVTALDPKAQADLYALIHDLNRSGITIIMVSHDISSALKYATHILHIAKKQLFFGTVNDYINSKSGIDFIETEGQ